MDDKEIKQKARDIDDAVGLLSLLNLIKKDTMERAGMGDKYHPFTMKQLNYYRNPSHTYNRYRQFKIKKKSGGYRQITAPRNPSYKALLRCVNLLFKAIYKPSDYAMGFTDGRSVVTNASHHIGKNYVFNIDLKDFFPSITQPRVWKRLQLEPFMFKQDVASILAGICSMKELRETDDGSMKAFYVMPQGAPTSPIITNMVCDNLDRRLAGLARRFNLTYTRYADDITFSSNHNVYQEDSDFRRELSRIITGQGFTINEKKTRLLKRGTRQEVTGITVNARLNVVRKYTQDLRNILFIWRKYGHEQAVIKFTNKYIADKGHVKRIPKSGPCMESVLYGKLLYLRMVKGEDDSVYKRLLDSFMHLVERDRCKLKGIIHQHKSTDDVDGSIDVDELIKDIDTFLT